MALLNLKPTSKAVKAYYEALRQFAKLGVKHEGAVRSAFQALLEHCGRQAGRTLVPEYQLKRKGKKPLEPDGAIVDSLSQVLRYGLWEAKDTDDDLEREVAAKFKAGYPRDNIVFQEPKRAILYQNGEKLVDADLAKPDQLVHVLGLFFGWQPPAFDQWERAVEEFKGRVQELGENLAPTGPQRAPDQHEVPSRLRRVPGPLPRVAQPEPVRECRGGDDHPAPADRAYFPEGVRHRRFHAAQRDRAQIEKVIEALTSRAFSRDGFVKNLEHFYIAIEQAAETIGDFSEKQRFLNTVYERFFQGFSVKVADTHGIVYTPQPLVDFMAASVEHVLRTEFGSSLAHRDVHVLDPFTGTGNFIVNLMRRIPKASLLHKYRGELHCNELMLLPYYVASMNIEHAFWEATGLYEAFEGICLVDTFETAEKEQRHFDVFNEANAERVRRQLRAPIKVIIANPPYNAGQVNENDNNKNRKYEEIDRRVRVTYGADSKATLLRKLSDPYVKAIRYAADRIGEAGVVCYVNNDSFVAEKTFDGMRKHLRETSTRSTSWSLAATCARTPRCPARLITFSTSRWGSASICSSACPARRRETPRQASLSCRAGRLAATAEVRLSQQGRVNRRAEVAHPPSGRQEQLAHQQERWRVRRLCSPGQQGLQGAQQPGATDSISNLFARSGNEPG